MQIDIGSIARVKRIATQGRYDANQYVKTYTMTYGYNGAKFYSYKEGKRVRVRNCNAIFMLCNAILFYVTQSFFNVT